MFGVEPETLIESYGLDQVFQVYYEEHPLTDEDVVVKVPKVMVDAIQKRPWFKYYHDIEDFVVDAVRKARENWEMVRGAGFTHKFTGKNMLKICLAEFEPLWHTWK